MDIYIFIYFKAKQNKKFKNYLYLTLRIILNINNYYIFLKNEIRLIN